MYEYGTEYITQSDWDSGDADATSPWDVQSHWYVGRTLSDRKR